MENETCYCLYHQMQEDISKFPKSMQKEGGYCNGAIQEYLEKKAQGKDLHTSITVYCHYHKRKEDISLFYPNDIQKRRKVACIKSKKLYGWWYDLQKKDESNHLICRCKKTNKDNFLQFLSEIEALIESGKYILNDVKGSLHEYFSQNRSDLKFCWNHMQYEPSHWFWESQFNKTVLHPKCKSSILAWRDFVKIQPKKADGMIATPKNVLRKEFTQNYLPAWELENAEEVTLLRSKDIFIEAPMFVPVTKIVKVPESISDTQNIETHDSDAMTVEEVKALNQPECFCLPGSSEIVKEDIVDIITPIEDPVIESSDPLHRTYNDLELDLKNMEIEITRLKHTLSTRDEVITNLNANVLKKEDEVLFLTKALNEWIYKSLRAYDLVSELTMRLLKVEE